MNKIGKLFSGEFNDSFATALFVFMWNICAVTATTYDNPDCQVDKSLPMTSPNNYMSCDGPETTAQGRTKCCTLDNVVGCCDPGGNSKKMQLIGICLGVITVTLAAVLIYVFWCRKTDNKHVVYTKQVIRGRYHRIQESCSCLACCRRQVEARKEREVLKEMAKEVPAYQLPSVSKGADEGFDNFWKGPIVVNK